jgi:hypothetical protein
MKIQWPLPANWEDFEDMCYRLALAERALVSGRKYGRRGQEQHGVDIVGQTDHVDWRNVGIQCKLKTEYLGGELRATELNEVYEKSKALQPRLDKLYVATTIARDTEIAALVDQINESWQRRHFLEVWCWEDICNMLDSHPTTAARYYPQFAGTNDLQCGPSGSLEVFLSAPADDTASRRMGKLCDHTSFLEGFRAAAPEVANVLSEYVQNCLHVRKGKARRVVITFDGTELAIEDDGQVFDPLDTTFPVKPDQMGLRTIQGLANRQKSLSVRYFAKCIGESNTFNRFTIQIEDREGIASCECSVHVDAADFFTRGDALAYFEMMAIPANCDPFTIHIGTARHSSSSGTHELLKRLKEFLGDRGLVVVVAPHRPDLYEALKGSISRWSGVSLRLL